MEASSTRSACKEPLQRSRKWARSQAWARSGPFLASSNSRFFKEYLFEMKWEVLLAFLIYHHDSLEAVDDVEVFRLDLVRLDWIRVARFRGKTMFLKERRCDWVDSEEYGCRDMIIVCFSLRGRRTSGGFMIW